MRIAEMPLVGLVALSFALSSCQPATPAEVSAAPAAINTASVAATATVPPRATSTPEYQRLSPASIIRLVQTEVSIEASLFARESCVKFEVRVDGFQWGPSFPRDSRLIKQVAFLDSVTGDTLPVELVLSGGGGGGGDGVPITMEEALSYDVKSPAVPAHIAALVTFDEALGITEPVRFDLKPTARPNMYCPQLPATTPEA